MQTRREPRPPLHVLLNGAAVLLFAVYLLSEGIPGMLFPRPDWPTQAIVAAGISGALVSLCVLVFLSVFSSNLPVTQVLTLLYFIGGLGLVGMFLSGLVWELAADAKLREDVLDLGDPENRWFLYIGLGFPLLLITWGIVAGRISLSWERLLKSHRKSDRAGKAAANVGEPHRID